MRRLLPAIPGRPAACSNPNADAPRCGETRAAYPTMLLLAVGLPQSAPSVNFLLRTVGRGPPYLGMFAGLAVDPPEGHSSDSNHRRNVPVYWPGGATQYGLKAQTASGGACFLASLPID
jgi:hypothetical protein